MATDTDKNWLQMATSTDVNGGAKIEAVSKRKRKVGTSSKELKLRIMALGK